MEKTRMRMPGGEHKNTGLAFVMWLTILLSVTFVLPQLLSGKYRSEFSRTIEFSVCPPVTEEGIPADGQVRNDTAGMNPVFPAATISEASKSELLPATPSEATKSELPPATSAVITEF